MVNLFILGVERSATTWVSNIIEAHPDTCVYMEPISSYVSGLESWPSRFTRLKHLSHWAEYFGDEFKTLRSKKRFLFTQYFDSKYAWDTDYLLASLADQHLNLVSARDFQELNFHRLGNSFEFTKNNCKLSVVKELRLNYNAEIIHYINSDARVIVVTRGYGPVIESIYKQINKGNLNDLKGDISKCCKGKITKKDLFNYWYESYNKMLKKLDKIGAKKLVLNHKKLLKGQHDVKSIIRWLDLNESMQVKKYVQYSNKKGSGKKNTHRKLSSLLDKARTSKKRIDARYSFTEEYPKRDTHPELISFFR